MNGKSVKESRVWKKRVYERKKAQPDKTILDVALAFDQKVVAAACISWTARACPGACPGGGNIRTG